MPLTTLGIRTPADSDAFWKGALAMREGFEDVDDMLDLPAPAWGAAAAGAIAAGVATSLGSIAIPALKRRATLHVLLTFQQTAATASHCLLTPNYANARVDSALGALRFPTAPSASVCTQHYALAVNSGVDVTNLGFTITPVLALAAGARLRGWLA